MNPEADNTDEEKGRKGVQGNVNIADFTAMGLIGLDMDATVRIPEANGTVFAATEAIITVAVEPRRQNSALMPLQYVHLLPRQIRHAHRFSLDLHSLFSHTTAGPPPLSGK